MARMVGCVVGGLLGFYIGKTYNKYVKSIGTALVGATMLAFGVVLELNLDM